MKVKEFVDKYIGRARYAEDRKFFSKYAEGEVVAWCAAGYEKSWSGGGYVSAFVFQSARLTLGFVNGHRVKVGDALAVIENAKMEKDDLCIEELRRLVLMESL